MKKTVFSLFSFGILISQTALAEPPSGKDLYQKKMCAACHGARGEGKAPMGTPLKGLTKSCDQLVAEMKKGYPKMKPVKATDEELKALADYVLTFK